MAAAGPTGQLDTERDSSHGPVGGGPSKLDISGVYERVRTHLAASKTITGRQLVLTSPVEDVVKSVCKPLAHALAGGIDYNGGSCFLVIGSKGTGKTSLLRACAGEDGAFAAAAGADKVLTLHLDMNMNASEVNPQDYIREALALPSAKSAAESTTRTPSKLVEQTLLDVNDQLAKNQQALVLLLDEYQSVYSAEAGNCQLWRLLMYSIPNLTYQNTRRIFAVVSGSSAWLRGLAFGKLSVDSVCKEYPGYTHITKRINLNIQRYACSYLDNFNLDDCRAILRSWGTMDEDKGNDYYFNTGGVPRIMECYDDQQTPFMYNKAKLTGCTFADPLLNSMAELLNDHLQQLSGPPTPLDLMFKTPVVHLSKKMAEDGSALETSSLYRAADEGAIRFHDGDGTPSVSFPAPVLAAYMIQLKVAKGGPSWLTPHLRLALAFPYGQLGIEAEEAFRRSIFENHLKLPPTDYNDSAVFYYKTGKFQVEGQDIADDDRKLYVFKEMPDTAGADVVWIKDNELYRCQLKLGVAKRKHSDMVAVINKIAAASTAIAATLDMRVVNVVAVTNPTGENSESQTVSETAAAHDPKVTIWNKKYLDENIWLKCVQDWAKATKQTAYYPDPSALLD